MPINLKNAGSGLMPSSRFTQDLMRLNRPRLSDFKTWLFHPGMLFGAAEKWWGDLGPRPSPHEGLDLCFFVGHRDRIGRLNAETRIPALYRGTVGGMQKDFIGRSLFMIHEATKADIRRRLLIAYGHMELRPDLSVGQTVAAGEVIGRLAPAGGSRSGVSAHLHLSVAQLRGAVAVDALNWQIISTHPLLTLQDPLGAIDEAYRISSDPAIDSGY